MVLGGKIAMSLAALVILMGSSAEPVKAKGLGSIPGFSGKPIFRKGSPLKNPCNPMPACLTRR